jgi:hypothetical protein
MSQIANISERQALLNRLFQPHVAARIVEYERRESPLKEELSYSIVGAYFKFNLTEIPVITQFPRLVWPDFCFGYPHRIVISRNALKHRILRVCDIATKFIVEDVKIAFLWVDFNNECIRINCFRRIGASNNWQCDDFIPLCSLAYSGVYISYEQREGNPLSFIPKITYLGIYLTRSQRRLLMCDKPRCTIQIGNTYVCTRSFCIAHVVVSA